MTERSDKIRAAIEKEATAERNVGMCQRAAFAAKERFAAAIAAHERAQAELKKVFDELPSTETRQ